MDLNFFVEVQLIVDPVICVVFAAVVKTGTGLSREQFSTKYTHSLQHCIVYKTRHIIISLPENNG